MHKPFQFVVISALAVFALAGCGAASPPLGTASPAAPTPATSSPATPSPATPSATPTPSATHVSITLLTESAPAQACMDALAQGTLVPDPRSGLALATVGGERMAVMWPFGYSARLVDGEIELINGAGAFVAREGDVIQMGGGSGANGLFYACAEGIQVVGS